MTTQVRNTLPPDYDEVLQRVNQWPEDVRRLLPSKHNLRCKIKLRLATLVLT